MTFLVLKMGGKGTRFGSDVPKQYHLIDDKPLFYYILEDYKKLGIIDKYVLVSNKDWIEYSNNYASSLLGDSLLDVIVGGDTGAKSIKNGIMRIRNIAKDDDIILLHDATNPIVVNDKIRAVIAAAQKYGFSSLGTEQVHAVYTKDSDNFVTGTIEKAKLVSGYSPEAFIYKYIYDCYATANEEELETSTSAIAMAKMHNKKPKIIVASFLNLKITYKNDLELYKEIKSKQMR